jgi:hypothetical protein
MGFSSINSDFEYCFYFPEVVVARCFLQKEILGENDGSRDIYGE